MSNTIAMMQPMFSYNCEFIPGAYVAYNVVISTKWKAEPSNI